MGAGWNKQEREEIIRKSRVRSWDCEGSIAVEMGPLKQPIQGSATWTEGFPGGSAGSCNPGTWVRSLGWEDPWRRERLPTPVFWPGELHGLCSPWGLKESDTTE